MERTVVLVPNKLNLMGVHPRQHIKKQRHYFANQGPSGQGYDFSSGHVWMWVGLWRKLSAKELTLLNYGVEDSWESLGLQGDPTSPS